MRKLSMIARVGSWSAVPFLLTACIIPNIHKTDEFSGNTGVQTLAIDAKQRVVVVAKRPDPSVPLATALANAAKASGSADRGLISVTCAEPSPDALSALSTSVGGGLQDPKVAANFAVAVSESTASIGLRTQSIQLLRDGMYRLCEGYAAGAIDAPEFNRQQRRYQNLMLSLLAIEQLTGAVVPRQVGLGDGSSGASVGDNADQAAADATTATNAVTDAQTALTKAQATQTSDASACTAAAPDTTNPSCGKAADDKTDVATKQATLDTAKKKEDTAKQVLQAARGAVKAQATGAHATFSDAPKTNGITDGSARYIAEATRTIVGTTLIASFAQEECSRLWDYVATATTAEKIALFTALDGGHTPEKFGIQELASNCRDSQQSLLSRVAMFTPDYGAPAPPALSVIGADTAIPMAVGGGAIDLRIIGGTPPYEAIVTPALKLELEATIPPAKGSVRNVHLDRPKGATKTGPATVTLVDANNAHVEIPVTLEAAAKAPAATTLGAPTDVKAQFAAGKFTVTFTPPKTGVVDSYIATATGADAKKAPSILSAPGSATAKSIELPACVADEPYTISVEAKTKTGESTRGVAPGTTPCSAAPPVTPPPAADKAPAAPTDVKATAVAGGKFTVTFTASKDDGGGAVAKYTANAKDTTKDSKEPVLMESATDAKKAITLSKCKAKATYAITVMATRGALSSTPSKEATATCLP